MFLNHNQKTFKISMALITLGAIILGFFCIGILVKTMHTERVGTNLIATQNKQLCCNANVSHSLDSWKNVLVSIQGKIRDGLMLLGLALTLSFTSLFMRYHSLDIEALKLRLYIKENPNITLFNHLKLAFIQGILNPRVY